MLALEEEQEEEDDKEEGGVMTDFLFVSPVQIEFLRKESKKRESNRKLPKYTLPHEEHAMEIAPETIHEICDIFDMHELVEVRGVSNNDKKGVYYTAHALANTLEDAMDKSVVVVDIKGFAVKLYCPWDDEDDDEDGDEERGEGEGGGGGRVGKRIRLRSNYRPGQWTRKAKPIRDDRGQIVTDEDGNSIKEIPED